MIDPNAEVIVLCYHRLEGKAGGALSIEPDLFREHMQILKDHGLSVISMKQFLAWRRGEGTIPPKSVLITIDDGYESGYKVGFPILKEFGYPATYFIYTTYLNSGGKSITWDQLEELRDAGMEIGSHTVSHKNLKLKSNAKGGDYDAWLKNELETSKQILEDHLGIRVAAIAYPFGYHNDVVDKACRDAGYEAGFSTYGQRLGMTADPFALGRYDVTTKDARGVDSFTVAVSFEGMKAPAGESVMAQDAAASMITEPANGATINSSTPSLKANLSTMGQLDPGSVTMRLSGVGKVPAKFDPETGLISYTVTKEQKLRPGPVSVIIGAKSKGRKVETRWSFVYDPSAEPASPAETELPPRKASR